LKNQFIVTTFTANSSDTRVSPEFVLTSWAFSQKLQDTTQGILKMLREEWMAFLVLMISTLD